MEYSLMQAAERAGLSKATIHRAVRSGRLSARRDTGGAYRIDASELARVYPETLQEMAYEAVRNHPETVETMAVMQERVRSLEVQLADAHETGRRERETSRDSIADLRRRLDRAEERVLALSPPSQPPMPAAAVVEPVIPASLMPSKPPPGFLARLLGRA